MTSRFTTVQPPRRRRWLAKLVALLALINFSLVLFDLSYVPWRDFYLQELPVLLNVRGLHTEKLTQLYDPIKGIEPHYETQNYLDKVDALEQQLAQTEARSPEAEGLLQQLRLLSSEMIEDNPFAVAQKSGTLEKIKRLVRDRVEVRSSHKAFERFWSAEYLAEVGWQSELNFFDQQVRPLIETNYYRAIDTNGKFVDQFWRLDLPFVIVFALDFLVRTFAYSRRQPQLSWFGAMLRRWYDLPLLLPVWRWLRIVPLTIRLHQANLLNLDPIRAQINHDVVANFAEELTDVVGVRAINQLQTSIRRGEVTHWLLHPDARQPYIHVNETNEVQAIATRLLRLSVYDVLPQVQPDVQNLVQHLILTTLNQSPVYQQLQRVPGMNQIPNQLAEQLAKDLSQGLYQNLAQALSDPVTAKLTNQLTTRFRDTLEQELQKQHNMQEIQALVIDLLEEIKLNYVKDIAKGGLEQTVEETEQLRYKATLSLNERSTLSTL